MTSRTIQTSTSEMTALGRRAEILDDAMMTNNENLIDFRLKRSARRERRHCLVSIQTKITQQPKWEPERKRRSPKLPVSAMM